MTNIQTYHTNVASLYRDSLPLMPENLRAVARNKYDQTGFPSKKEEAWKYLDVAKLAAVKYEPSTPLVLNVDIEHAENEYLAVLYNGYFIHEKSSLPTDQQLIVCSMVEASMKHADIFVKHIGQSGVNESNFFTLQNSAFTTNGIFVYVPKNYVSDKVLKIVNITPDLAFNQLSQPRNLIVADANSSLTINISHETQGVAENKTLIQSNAITEVFVGENAAVKTNIVIDDNNNVLRINTIKAVQSKGSTFGCNAFSLAGRVIRNAINVELKGEGCTTDLNGYYQPNDGQHFENLTYIHHLAANCKSSQLFKGIVGHNATAVFNGMVYVAANAQQTNAYQSNKNIALHETSSIHSRPQLEIYADDVKCSHGSTTGQLDENALFFMQARGIGKNEAKELMMGAFAAEAVNKVEYDALREELLQRV